MSKKITVCAILIFLFSTIGQTNAEKPDKPVFSAGMTLGTNGGFGVEFNGMVSNVSPEFPLSLRVAVGYTSLEPGISADARRIFINDATNGVPEESGHKYDYKFDLVFPFKILSLQRSFVYGGPRYTQFLANFKYIGGNEDFDVRSNQWGIGGGVESYFSISPKFDLLLNTGADYLKESDLQGHDTMYSPDGTTGNERDDYTYDDADAAINQPKLALRFMIGLKYNF